MDFEDKELTCGDCGMTFVFTARDQEFFATKGFQEPKRCPDCRRSRKASRDGGGGGFGGGGRDRRDFEVVCAECGQVTTVPFEPRGDRPVYCRDCFESRRPRR